MITPLLLLLLLLLQMTTVLDANVHNIAVTGGATFDDCQDFVKEAFGDEGEGCIVFYIRSLLGFWHFVTRVRRHVNLLVYTLLPYPLLLQPSTPATPSPR